MSDDHPTTPGQARDIAASESVATSEAVSARDRLEVETHIKRLPPLSPAIHAILDKLRDVDSDMRWLEEHISADPSLATRLLKMANSAFYSGRSKIYTIPRALMTLGFRTSLNVLLAASMRTAFRVAVRLPGFKPQGLTRHSVAVGTCAAALGRALPCLDPVRDKLFVAGLLHDIGRVALSPLYERHLDELRARVTETPPRPEVERDILGIDHCEAGGMVIQQWRLPEEFADPIALHHQEMEPQSCTPLVLAVRAADLFVLGRGHSIIAPCEVAVELDAVLAMLGTSTGEVEGLLAGFESEAEAFLGAVA